MNINNNKDFQFNQKEPDHIVTLDVAGLKNLQIGYQAETIFLKAHDEDQLVIKEYINGLEGTEYYAKIAANRFKTTIRYGRREEVNTRTFVEVFLPRTWHGELQLSTSYGCISTQDDWELERLDVQANEGSVLFKTIKAPRIRISTATSPVYVDKAIGFLDIHTVSGPIHAGTISGGAKLATSDAPIIAAFESLNNIIETTTLNGLTQLTLPKETGMKVDGVSKRGDISCDIEGLEVKVKPGKVTCVTGQIGEKPFQNVRLSSINGNIQLL